MKKIINSPDKIVEDMLQGFVKANKRILRFSRHTTKVIVKKEIEDKVGVVIGGGSGHEPLFMGYVGEGLADAVVVGNIFAAPTPNAILTAIKEVDRGKGVICIFGNYSGDVLNFEMGKDLAAMEGIDVTNIVVKDDVASASKNEKKSRRGIAGDLYMIKILGAASQIGKSIEECFDIAKQVDRSLVSIGVGLSPGTNPVNGEPGFYLEDGEMEFGLGIHGESGIEQRPITTSNEISKTLVELLISEMRGSMAKEIAICVNGLGSTTLMELYIIANDVQEEFDVSGYNVSDILVGNFCTTQEMGGFSISAILLNEELKTLFNMKAISSHFYKGV
ncbi:dihydroxyacetone kinase subunit DhaK [Tetragenococcus solitarius]|uniref:Dihydroxyacetone kinase subunit DhaK n=1 Tax=Tetragenococcus solitarius TaxID=71453 RepID=A0ABP6KJJ8_9ENTE|nr:dihydroxyacetone kinase subunit DhaK [Tetragenococcus solitarius]